MPISIVDAPPLIRTVSTVLYCTQHHEPHEPPVLSLLLREPTCVRACGYRLLYSTVSTVLYLSSSSNLLRTVQEVLVISLMHRYMLVRLSTVQYKQAIMRRYLER